MKKSEVGGFSKVILAPNLVLLLVDVSIPFGRDLAKAEVCLFVRSLVDDGNKRERGRRSRYTSYFICLFHQAVRRGKEGSAPFSQYEIGCMM